MRLAKQLLLATTLFPLFGASAVAEVNVVTSIKPVHSLVSAVMEGVGEPTLIVDGAASPHNFALKPSQAQMIEDANIIFWIGHELEAFLEKPIETVGANAKSIELIDAHDLIKLGFREGGAFDDHGHDDHAEDAHDDHDDHDHDKEDAEKHDDHKDHDDHSDHGHKEKAEADGHDNHEHDHDKEEAAESGEHDDHEEHAHGEFDAHIWLDPMNAKAIVHEIEEALVEADPANAEKYEANAAALSGKIDTLIANVSADLEPVHGKGYIVFHDAYQYFEKRFNVSASGSITVSPDVMPGAERISEIRNKVRQLGSSCFFAEPQFVPKLVSTVVEGTQAKSAIIDPLGASLENGPELYFDLIRNMATSIKTCLTKAG